VDGVDQLRKALDTDDRAAIQRIESRATDLVEKAPESAILRNLLAQAQLKNGKAEEALASFQRATALAALPRWRRMIRDSDWLRPPRLSPSGARP
jgi:predicted Zn-dependent protease